MPSYHQVVFTSTVQGRPQPFNSFIVLETDALSQALIEEMVAFYETHLSDSKVIAVTIRTEFVSAAAYPKPATDDETQSPLFVTGKVSDSPSFNHFGLFKLQGVSDHPTLIDNDTNVANNVSQFLKTWSKFNGAAVTDVYVAKVRPMH